MRRRCSLLVVLLLAASQSPPAATAAGAPALSVLGQGDVAVKAETGQDTAAVYLVLLDSGQAPATISVAFEASSAAGVRVASFSPRVVPPGDVKRVKVTLAGLKKLTDTADGQLVVKGGATPVARSVAITPAPQPSADWSKILIIGSLIAMAMLALGVVIRACTTSRWRKALQGRAPGPKWSFESWATTLTAVGAITGTVLSAVTLPDVPREIDKETLVRLNLLFGALVVTAPFVFQAIRSPKVSPASQDAGLWGFNWSLLLACSITCGAVLGELGTLALLAWELIVGGTWGWVAVAAVGVLGLLAIYYFVVTAWALAITDWKAVAAADRASAGEATKSALLGLTAATRGEAAPDVAVAPPPPIRRTWSLP